MKTLLSGDGINMGKRLRFALKVTFGISSVSCFTSYDEMDGEQFDPSTLTADEIQVVLYSARLGWWRYVFYNPLAKYPRVWGLGSVVRDVINKGLIDPELFEIKSDINGVLCMAQIQLGHPISLGRLCALLAWASFFCKSDRDDETWLRCKEIAAKIKTCLY